MLPEQLAADIERMDPAQAAYVLDEHDDDLVVAVLERLSPAMVSDIIPEMEESRRERLYRRAPQALTRQWSLNQTFDEDAVGRLMEPPAAVFRPTQSVGEVIDRVRDLVKQMLVTYCYVTDARGKLVGLVTMRDLLVSDHGATLESVMLRDVFTIRPTMPVADAMREVVRRHYPVYPVCDDNGVLVGLVRGHTLFTEHTFEISATPGRMVGVDKEERLITPWPRSLKFRHPWLQLNLFTAFIAAGVVGIFQETLDQIVVLALFLPVLAGQSGNTGCQALAVTLRGMTLGEFRNGSERALVAKEALLGTVNGALVGATAGLGMYIVALMQDNPSAIALGVIVAIAMVGSCVISGLSGALIPLALKRLGADPATASSIFLTTATDVVSIGMLLGLATLLLV